MDDAIGVFEFSTLQVRSDREGEERWKAIGLLKYIIIVVIYTPRGNARRIISARKARESERRAYDKAYSDG